MKKLFKTALLAAMCMASFGCNSKVNPNFDDAACTVYTNVMAEAESKIVKEYGTFYNNLRGRYIDIAADKYKHHLMDLLTEAYNHKQLSDREYKVMLYSTEAIYSNTFLAYKQVNMSYEIRQDRKGFEYAHKVRAREMKTIEDIVYKACRYWQ